MDKEVERVYEEAQGAMENIGIDWEKVLSEFQALSTPERMADILSCIQALENEMVLRDQVDIGTYKAILEVVDPVDLHLVRQAFFGSYKEMGEKLDHLRVFPYGSLEDVIREEFQDMKILADVPVTVRPYIDYEALAEQWRRCGQYVEGHKVYEYEDYRLNEGEI